MGFLLKLAVVAVCAFAVVPASLAQSRPGQPATQGKINKRPEPSPLPTPGTQPPDVPAGDDGDVIKVNTQLVSVPVRVMDKKGRFIGGLSQDNFKVFEDGVEQDIALFSNEHQAFTVALVLDMSYSTTFKLADIQSAAIQFIDQLRPQDKVMVVSFDQDVHVLCEPTFDRQQVYRAIKSTKISTGTSIYEAMDLVMNRVFRPIQGRKAIILFTDGVDTTSRRRDDRQNLSDAMELDALIYPIHYDTFADVQRMKNSPGAAAPPPITIPADSRDPVAIIRQTATTPSSRGTTEAEYKKAAEYLDELAVRTGGRSYEASTLTNLADAYSKIASELREFYSISYYPHNERTAGDTFHVKVKVDQQGMVVQTRDTFLHPDRKK